MLRVCDSVDFRSEGSLRLAHDSEQRCAECWAAATRANPALFDGPIVLATTLGWDGARCSIRYVASSYSKYVWMRKVGAMVEPRVGSLYVSALAITADGYLLTGRMSASTSTPGRIQLPGGNIEPDPAGLTEPMARASAAEELAEETGLVVDATALALTHAICSEDSADVGVLYTTTLASTLREVEQRFLAHSRGKDNEFDQLVAFTRARGTPREAPGPCVDYLPAVITEAFALEPESLEYVETSGSAGDTVVTVGVNVR
jgi:8-oxo-dGTP pyrophosphatase MutT (NUDIX family)